MYINKTIETKEGGVKFEGELAQEELDVVLGIGLNWLLKQGALPVVISEDSDETLMEPSDNIQ